MLNLKEKAIFLGFIFTAIISMTDFSGKCDGINDKILRLHVLANSNSEEDQNLKLRVRDRILLYCSQYVEEGMTEKEIVRKIISDHKNEIEQEAKDEIIRNGYNYSVNVEIARDVYFNTRNYKTVKIPAGNYEAVRILIGEGKGSNWWCVMFPPMCLPAAEERRELKEVLNEGQMDLVGNENPYEIKFKVWEIFISFRNFTISLFDFITKE